MIVNLAVCVARRKARIKADFVTRTVSRVLGISIICLPTWTHLNKMATPRHLLEGQLSLYNMRPLFRHTMRNNNGPVRLFQDNSFIPSEIVPLLSAADSVNDESRMPVGLSTPLTKVQTAPPADTGNNASFQTLGVGDFSKTNLSVGKRILDVNGGHTLGSPRRGFKLSPENSNVNLFIFNGSGWNQDTRDNGGRTSVADLNLRGFQYGAGGTILGNGNCTLTDKGDKLGATTFLANPACELFAGSVTATGSGVFAQALGDFTIFDNGHDISMLGGLINLRRTNSIGALGTTAMGWRAVSIGSRPVDSFFSGAGPTGIGSDYTAETYPDRILAAFSIANGGYGYTNNDLVYVEGGLGVDTRTTFLVEHVVNGVVPSDGLVPVQAGKYSGEPPSGVVSTTTSGSGRGLMLNVTYLGNASEALPTNGRVYGGASLTKNLADTRFSNATLIGTNWSEYDAVDGWRWYVGGKKMFNVNGDGVDIRTSLNAEAGVTMPIRDESVGSVIMETAEDYTLVVDNRLGKKSIVDLDPHPGRGRIFTVKDGTLGPENTMIIIKAAVGQAIDGSPTYTIVHKYGWATLQYDGSNWWVIGKG
jgi:hypothetical protein